MKNSDMKYRLVNECSVYTHVCMTKKDFMLVVEENVNVVQLKCNFSVSK